MKIFHKKMKMKGPFWGFNLKIQKRDSQFYTVGFKNTKWASLSFRWNFSQGLFGGSVRCHRSVWGL
jgi:hypothetical protein